MLVVVFFEHLLMCLVQLDMIAFFLTLNILTLVWVTMVIITNCNLQVQDLLYKL